MRKLTGLLAATTSLLVLIALDSPLQAQRRVGGSTGSFGGGGIHTMPTLPPIRDLGVTVPNRSFDTPSMGTGTNTNSGSQTGNRAPSGSSSSSPSRSPAASTSMPFNGDLSLAVPTDELRNRWHYGRAGHF